MGRLARMQRGTGPLIRPASLRRPTRQQIARRRAFVVFLVVLLAVSVWRFWPSSGARGGGRATAPASTDGHRRRPGRRRRSPSPGVIVPGENPIKHVIFLIKENRTFDHYFGTYPGAEGTTVGGTLRCTEADGCVPGPDYQLQPAPYIQPARHHARLRERPVRDQRRRDERLQHHRRGRRHERATCSTRAGPCRTTGRTRIASSWPTTSSRRCTGPRSPSTSTPWPRRPTASSTTRRNADTPGSYCDDPPEYTKKFRDDLSKRERPDDHEARGQHHRRRSPTSSYRSPVLGGHPDLHRHRGAARTCWRRRASAGSTTASRTSG